MPGKFGGFCDDALLDDALRVSNAIHDARGAQGRGGSTRGAAECPSASQGRPLARLQRAQRRKPMRRDPVFEEPVTALDTAQPGGEIEPAKLAISAPDVIPGLLV